MKVYKLNESFSAIEAEPDLIQKMFEFLKVERPGAYFEKLVKIGFKSPYNYFSSIQNGHLLVMNGHLHLLKQFGVQFNDEISDFTIIQLNNFISEISKILPFNLYDFQIKAFKESILNVKQINKMATGSGKSVVIALIAEFFRLNNKKGLLLVPNINLLTQFQNDIKEYNLLDLYNNIHIIGGGNTIKHFDKNLTISTWQSMISYRYNLDVLNYVITDECHRFASEVTSSIVKETINCKYKFGFTGTLPEDPTMKMQLFGLFGLPKIYITSNQLISKGLATPVKINSIIFKYNKIDKNLFKSISEYPKKLKFIKDHEKRNEFIVNLSIKVKESGNTLLLFSHTEHGKGLFYDVMAKLHPDIKVENKDITGKKSFDFQNKYGIYFLNGQDDSKTRELTRKILESHTNALLIANFQILSTGVNIKRLFNMILASPLRSYNTITQSIGRGMRLFVGKKIFNVYDLIDDFGIIKPSGVFYKQYQHRKNTSYNPEEFPVVEQNFHLI
jgi:superfamily II DNA or RNA helicase